MGWNGMEWNTEMERREGWEWVVGEGIRGLCEEERN